MQREVAYLVLVSMLAIPLDAPAQIRGRSDCTAEPNGKVVLVLPGGGAKGYAHVGVIKMLDSLGIVPDMVVGTSMGSIMGAMYASGYNGAEIERLTQRFNIGPYVGKYSPRPPRAFAITGAVGASSLQSQVPGATIPLVLLKRNEGGISVSTSLAQEGAVNMLLTAMMLRGNLIARGNFDSLPTPFRAVAADNRTGERVVLNHGDLALAVRASMAIPFVFEPGVIDSVRLVDGGLIENVPVRLARELGATRVILSTLDATKGLDSATRVQGKGTLDMMLDRIFLDTHPPLGPNDIEIRTDVSDVGNLDFKPEVVTRLTNRGADAARPILAAACLPHRTRVVREMPPVVTALVTSDAAPGSAELMRSAVRFKGSRYSPQAVRQMMSHSDSAQILVDTMQRRLAHAGTTGVLRSLWITPLRAPGDSVVLDPAIGWAEQRTVGIGASFDNDLGGQGWVGIANRRASPGPITPLEAGARLTVGSLRQEFLISARKSIEDVRYGISPFGVLMVGRESSPFFGQGPSGTTVKVSLPIFTEQLLQVGFDIPNGDDWTIQVGALVRNYKGGLNTTGKPTPVGFALRIDRGDEIAPLFGRIDWEYNQRFARLSGRWTLRWPTSFASFTNTLRAGGTNKNAPYSQWFLLGGVDGFPGLNIGEFVGTWTASYMLDAAHPLIGPLNLQVTGMTGTVSRSTDVNFGGQWLWGARIGIGADPTIGQIRIQYGLATNGRRQWFARVGRWI